MPVTDFLPYFQLAGQASLVVGALFAGYQLLQVERGRREQTALQTVTSFNTQEFRDAFAKVYTLPLGASARQVQEAGLEEAATTVMMTFEMMGVLVHSRMVPVETVDQAIGGFARESWRRLEGYVQWKREAVHSARWGEWYQWLFEQLARNPRRSMPAYEAFKAWKPEPYKVWLRR
ncbi:MAG TPA: hypothetical protein VHI93_09630 [Candidatus Thermoplasmatota archaeon]|nr:hypothetical protein [Candidatus Thermoplasmatota archaeon]